MSTSQPNLTNIDVAIFALAELGGASKKIHTEHIAWKAYTLAPHFFSWRLPEYAKKGFPDKDRVRSALMDARKEESGELVKGRYGVDKSGNETDGWILTPEGVKWFNQNEKRIKSALRNSSDEFPKVEAQRFCKRVRQDPAFQLYEKEGSFDNVTPYMITDMLSCSPDAPRETVQFKFGRALATAYLVKDQAIIDFLEGCKEKLTILSEAS